MICPNKFNTATLDAFGHAIEAKCACEREKCAKWIPDPSNMLRGDCADVVAAKGLQALSGLAKMLGK